MRLVSLLASATEMIYQLGCIDQLVGRSHECDYPPQIGSLPVVSTVQINTNVSSAEIDAQIKELARHAALPADPALKALSMYAINVQMLEQLRPDVIFTQTQCEVCAVSERDVAQAVRQLTGQEPRIVSLAPYQLSDVWTDIRRVGEALARQEQAKQLVQGYQQRLEHLKEVTATFGSRPRVAVLEWLDPLMGAGNWTPELINYAGGEHVCGRVGEHTPWLSWHELQASDPDVLVLAPCGYSLERAMEDIPILQQHRQWQELRAVQTQRVYAIDGNQYINRSGPRLVDSAELLARVIWGELPRIQVDNTAWQQIQM